jgi:hypothetical protein
MIRIRSEKKEVGGSIADLDKTTNPGDLNIGIFLCSHLPAESKTLLAEKDNAVKFGR